MSTAVQPIESTERVPLAELQATPQWEALTVKQTQWVITYIESGYDAACATRSAYQVTTEDSRRQMDAIVLASPRVQAVLALHFKLKPIDIFLAELEQTVRREKGVARVRAMELLAKMQELKSSGQAATWGMARPFVKNGKIVAYDNAQGERVDL